LIRTTWMWYNMPVVDAMGKKADMVPMHVLIPPGLKEEIRQIAERNRRPFSIQVRMALEKMLEEERLSSKKNAA
jgi:hypothetical protein